ncbi:MAG: SGNH/GDSL hydrolase family protein, partial [Deltaproteobacteria bacterium]
MSKKTILLFLSIVLSSCLLEGLLRIHFHLLDPIEQAKRSSAKFDAVFGWDIKKNHEYKITDSGFYKVDERGFRFSPLTHNKDKKTILLIGDSFTHASNLANQDVYYRKLDDLKVNFYSYGVSGWSNLQEFLKVQEHITKIHPDIIIWQLSANDLIENVYQI